MQQDPTLSLPFGDDFEMHKGPEGPGEPLPRDMLLFFPYRSRGSVHSLHVSNLEGLPGGRGSQLGLVLLAS